MASKDKDKDSVAGTRETRKERQGGALSSHPTCRLRWWVVVLMEGDLEKGTGSRDQHLPATHPHQPTRPGWQVPEEGQG